jgi:hypothetical protein
MALVFTIVYLAYAVLSPASIYPVLEPYRIELWLFAVALLASILSLEGIQLQRLPQGYLVLGFAAAAAISLVANHWLGGAVYAVQRLMPSIAAFFLVALNVRSVRGIKALAGVLAVVAIFYTLQGGLAYFRHDVSSPFLLNELNEATDTTVPRIRGLGAVNDPNDLAQYFVAVLPMIWLFWSKGRSLRNTMLVLVPTAFLLVGLALTRSRGGMIALIVVIAVGLKPKLSRSGSLVATVLATILLLGVNFTGGRDVSVEAGQERIGAWSEGLEFLKSAPVFGIGFGEFGDRNDITAHNSFLLCAAELGMVGYFFWMGLLVVSFSDLGRILRPSLAATEPLVDESPGPDWMHAWVAHPATSEPADGDPLLWNLEPCARAVRLATIGFLAAGWFLSRSYVVILFIFLGLATALATMSQSYAPDDDAALRQRAPRRYLVLKTFGLQVLSILTIYLLVRVGRA